MRALAAIMALLLLVSLAHAIQPDEVLADPRLEARARSISAGLRCLVCQNQSIDDSDAPLARDLRLLVRDRLTAGDSDAAVRDFVVSRYGDFVLLKPPFKPGTALLWISPFLLLALGALGLVAGRRRAQRARASALTADEEARLNALLSKGKQ